MRDGKISELGPFGSTLTIGSTHKMNFQDDDSRPFWMSTQEKAQSKYDIMTDNVYTKEKSKSQLLVDLRSKGIDSTVRRF